MTGEEVSARAANPIAPNLPDYEAGCRAFSWERLYAELVERADDRLNIAMLAIDRPAARVPDRIAVRCVDAEYGVFELTYAGLLEQSNRFENLLRRHGAGRGDVVAALMGR